MDALRSDSGAVQNRFNSAITNPGNTVNNLSSARSRIEDSDYATEVSNMSRAQILQQAGTSVLAQANQSRRTCCLCYVNLFRFIQPRESGAFSFSIDEYIFMECIAVNDISYGREAEIWPRDYSMLARRVQFLRFNDIHVRLVSNNARIIIGYIAKFNPRKI